MRHLKALLKTFISFYLYGLQGMQEIPNIIQNAHEVKKMISSEDFTLIIRLHTFSPCIVSLPFCHFLENRALLPPHCHHKQLEIFCRLGQVLVLFIMWISEFVISCLKFRILLKNTGFFNSLLFILLSFVISHFQLICCYETNFFKHFVFEQH